MDLPDLEASPACCAGHRNTHVDSAATLVNHMTELAAAAPKVKRTVPTDSQQHRDAVGQRRTWTFLELLDALVQARLAEDVPVQGQGQQWVSTRRVPQPGVLKVQT